MVRTGIRNLKDLLMYWHFNVNTKPIDGLSPFRHFYSNLGTKVGFLLLLTTHFSTVNTAIVVDPVVPQSAQAVAKQETTVIDPVIAEPTQTTVKQEVTTRLLSVPDPPPIVNSIPVSVKSEVQTVSNPYVGLIQPIQGVYTNNYSSWHPGIDIAQKAGTPIKPIMGGKVISAGWEASYGLCVIVDHDNGYKSRYAHMSKISVKTGEIVYQESILGLVGTTGHSTGPHLHLEIYHDGKAINPLQIISASNKL